MIRHRTDGYILDQDGCAISDGYHEIHFNENGGYKGKRSAQTEQVALNTEADQAKLEYLVSAHQRPCCWRTVAQESSDIE